MSSKKACFKAGKTKVESRKYFESKKAGLLKNKEEIESIKRRYAPLAVFEFSWNEKVNVGFIRGSERKKENKNRFYVNLHNADLFYVKESFFGKKHIERTDFLKKIVDLPLPCVEFLADILKKGVISHRELNKKHFLF